MDIEYGRTQKWQNENIIINPFALYFGGEKRKKTKNEINKNYYFLNKKNKNQSVVKKEEMRDLNEANVKFFWMANGV